jgi:GNAT superfamily N-acetyltransferase
MARVQNFRRPLSAGRQAVRVGAVDVQFLSEHPERVEEARSVLEEYLRLPDAWARHGGVPDTLPDEFARLLARFPAPATPPGGDVAMALVEHGLVAAGHVVPFDGDACELSRVFVRPARQQHGVGTQLVAALPQRACAFGYRRVLIDVMPERERALRFWTAVGFRPCRPYRTYPFAMVFMAMGLVGSSATSSRSATNDECREG